MKNSYGRGVRAAAALGLAAAPVLGLAAPAADAKPELKLFADGTLSAMIPDSLLHTSMGQVLPDGSVREVCVNGAATVMLTAAPAPETK